MRCCAVLWSFALSGGIGPVAAQEISKPLYFDLPMDWRRFVRQGSSFPLTVDRFERTEDAPRLAGTDIIDLRRMRSVVIPRFRFRKASTQNSAEAFGVKAVLFTATRPAVG